MKLYSDGGLVFIGFILMIFLFHGDPDIADLLFEYLKQLTSQNLK